MSIWLVDRVRVRLVTSSLIVSALVGFAMIGCETVGITETPPPVTDTCQSAEHCKVSVVVTCTSSGCAITSPKKDDNTDANGFDVVWEIVQQPGQTYTFKNPGGIFFKETAGQQLFKCHPEGTGGTRFKCHSDTKDAKPYKYGIELVGTPVLTLDPWIVNR